MKYKIIKEELENIVKDSLNISEVCRKLGIVPAGGNFKTIKDKINQWNINISHFTGAGWNTGKRFRKFSNEHLLSDVLVKNSPYKNSGALKKRLIREGILQYYCVKCGLKEWMGEEITLELDHINGDNTDNRLENIRLLCPNCHSQTDTFRGRNIKQGE